MNLGMSVRAELFRARRMKLVSKLLSVSPIMRLRSVCGKALSPIRFITVPTAR